LFRELRTENSACRQFNRAAQRRQTHAVRPKGEQSESILPLATTWFQLKLARERSPRIILQLLGELLSFRRSGRLVP
jgi:hypothetical protein